MLHGLKDILKLYNVKALKNLSQNFIFDQRLLRRIAASGTLADSDTCVIEIGPAAGNLTRALLGHGFTNIMLIEKDLRFKPILEQLEDYASGKIELRFDDALKMKQSWIPESWKIPSVNQKKLLIIGNLPFAVATPLTLNLIKEYSSFSDGIFKYFNEAEMIFMFQDEVARKFTAKVGTRNYGRLSILSQAFCDVSYLFQIDSSKFTPRPKVDSGLVRFKFKLAESFASQQNLFEDLESLSRVIFRHKNKKLDSIDLPWASFNVNSNLRPVHLSPNTLIDLVQRGTLKFKTQDE